MNKHQLWNGNPVHREACMACFRRDKALISMLVQISGPPKWGLTNSSSVGGARDNVVL